jgi:hypothetical protein
MREPDSRFCILDPYLIIPYRPLSVLRWQETVQVAQLGGNTTLLESTFTGDPQVLILMDLQKI